MRVFLICGGKQKRFGKMLLKRIKDKSHKVPKMDSLHYVGARFLFFTKPSSSARGCPIFYMKYRNKHSETIDPREVDIFIVNVLERDAHFTSFLHFSRLTTDEIVLKIIYQNYHEKLPLIKNINLIFGCHTGRLFYKGKPQTRPLYRGYIYI